MADVRIVMNGNVKMSPGKLAAQAVHAALKAYGIDHDSVVVLNGSKRKVEEMDVQINDAGLTEVKPGTLTAGATIMGEEYSSVMSCCRSGAEHAKHRKHRDMLADMEAMGYIVIPPVSTGFGSAKMTLERATEYLQKQFD